MLYDFFSFKKVFVPYVQKDLKSKNLPPKAILILDNAPAHPEASMMRSEDGNVTCYFLPANSTCILQPMDQSVIETFKRRYRKNFIKNLVMEEDCSLADYWKKYTLKNAVDNSSDAWAEVSGDILKKAWNKLWPEEEEEESVDDGNDADVYDEIVTDSSAVFSVDETEIGDWLLCDVNEDCYRLLTEDEIIEMAREAELTDSEADTESEWDDGDTTDDETVKDERKDAREAAANMQKFIDSRARFAK